MSTRRVIGIFLLLAVVAPASAWARDDQWATVNLCDTPAHPDSIGVRASMPGNGKRQRMYMRFRTQFYSASEARWEAVAASAGRSAWIYVGSARRAYAQGGFTFMFEPPVPGRTYRLRGVVDLRWTDSRRHVLRRSKAVTEAGHPGTKGADPSVYSSELCEIR
jgi:hypothetical protein